MIEEKRYIITKLVFVKLFLGELGSEMFPPDELIRRRSRIFLATWLHGTI